MRRKPVSEAEQFRRDWEARTGKTPGRHPEGPRANDRNGRPGGHLKVRSQQWCVLEWARGWRRLYGERPFSLEQAAVGCYAEWPDQFRLGPFSCVDARKVAVCLCGRRGLVAAGVIEKRARNSYRAVP